MKIILTSIGVVALAGAAFAHTLRTHGDKQTLEGRSLKASFDAILDGSLTTTTTGAEASHVNPSKTRSLANGYNCVGNTLMGGSSIGRDEFVCSRDGKYRFGLDENGVLGEWHGNELNWSSGFSGSQLHMQKQDGNLVLRNEGGTALWAINCGANPNAYLYAKNGGRGGVRVLSESGKEIIWRTWQSGAEPTCFPKNSVDPYAFNCRSTMLNPDMPALFKDEFICGPDMAYAFGLDKDGMLGEWRNGELHWSPEVKGHRLQMQNGDGNLVLYKEDGSAVWATNCGRFPGAFLTATAPSTSYTVATGAKLIVQYTSSNDDTRSTTIWKTLKSGDSTCFPGYNEPAKCVGSHLDKDRRSLGRGEYICSNSGSMFGLNQDGLLGLWKPNSSHWLRRSQGILLWSPGVHGARLYMQYGDGNLVLRDAQGTPVWASRCTAPPGEHFTLLVTDMDGIQVQNKEKRVIWEVVGNVNWNSTGIESGCNPPDDEVPEVRCKSLKKTTDILHRNEYVCDYETIPFNVHFLEKEHRFGLNNRGQLVVWEGSKTIWTWGDYFGGDRLVKTSDNFIVYAADDRPMWKSCPISGYIYPGGIEMTPNSFQLVNGFGGVVWFIDYHSGVSSTCNPINVPQYDCPLALQYGCRVNVIDHVNLRNVQMGIQISSGYDFHIWGKDCFPWYNWYDESRSAIIMSGNMDATSISLTDDTVQYIVKVGCEDLSRHYIMKDDNQFEFVETVSSDCSEFSKSLIYYAIKANTHEIWEGKDLPGQNHD